jgi:predicted metal-dependent hydrolase
VTAEIRQAVHAWARCLDAGEYFEAHEVLERPWLHAADPEKTYLKGLIHAAVALYQYRRGNGHGARVKYASCVRYLSGPRPPDPEVDVDDLLRQMDAFFAGLVSQPPGTPPPPPPAPWPMARLRAEPDPAP